MSDTTFTDQSTVVSASWLNAMNDFFYTLFAGSTTAAQARTALGISEGATFTDTTLDGDTTIDGDVLITGDAILGTSTPAMWSIRGLDVNSNSSDPTHDIDISAGSTGDSTALGIISLSSTMTKRMDAAWAAGTGNGGMFTGSMSANATYHLHLIKKDSDGTIDAGFDTSITAVNRPAGYTMYRRRASIKVTSGNAIRTFVNHFQNYFRFTGTPIDDYNVGPVGATTAITITLNLPTGLILRPHLQMQYTSALSGGQQGMFGSSLDETDVVVDATRNHSYVNAATLVGPAGITDSISTNTSAQMRVRTNQSTGQIVVFSTGFYDENLLQGT